MEDLVEDGISDTLRAGVLDQRERVPLAHDGQMARPKQLK